MIRGGLENPGLEGARVGQNGQGSAEKTDISMVVTKEDRG